MKADITRSTFRKEKHYRKVNMQQGRVQVDADWNEQVDIQVHHDMACLQDIIGRTGTSIDTPGFAIEKKTIDLNDEIWIGAGNYYVDGVLCENENEVNAAAQLDLPNFKDSAVPKEVGSCIAYLDVWERHLTSIDDPRIREIALGGADTATRTKIVWQVKTLRIADKPVTDNRSQKCYSLSEFEKWRAAQTSTGSVQARVQPAKQTLNPCEMASETDYQGLENQLYRVEIHDAGEFGKTASWKWSRDNGAVVAKVASIEEGKITVESVGKDSKLSFAPGEYVEVTDDSHELWGLPGTLIKLKDVKENILFFDSTTASNGDAVTATNFQLNPKVRRWDSPGKIKVEAGTTENEGFLELELGVQVKFGEGIYRTGDYWLIPARTITKNVEWPLGTTATAPPEGISHHYAPLALLKCDFEERLNPSVERPGKKKTETELVKPLGKKRLIEPRKPALVRARKFEVVEDCRVFFSATTDLIRLNYVSGDGQEASQSEDGYFKTPFPLIASVSIGSKSIKETPLQNAKVFFKITEGNGILDPTKTGADQKTVCVSTNGNGLAVCDSWKLDATTYGQQVEALLVDDCDNSVGPPLRFNATLPIRFYYISGDGQETKPENAISLAVGAAIGKTPLQNYKVKFSVIAGGGTVATTDAVPINQQGFAMCDWHPGTVGKQQAMAELITPNDKLVNLPPIYFNATLDVAAAVSGIVRIIMTPDGWKRKVLISAPINHYLDNSTVPPAIILGLASDLGEKPSGDSVKFTEDYGLYNFGSTAVRFKAVNVNLKTFAVQIEFPTSSTQAQPETSSPNTAPAATTEVKVMNTYLKAADIPAMKVVGDYAKTVSNTTDSSPMPTEYWTRPIETGLQGWQTVPVPLSLRWWAIPAQTRKEYDQEVELAPSTTSEPCFLTLDHNTVGIGQTVTITGGATAALSKDKHFSGFIVTATKPDGTEETLGPYGVETGGPFSLTYTPDQMGTFTFKLSCREEKLNGAVCEPCERKKPIRTVSLTVQ